MFVVYAVLGLFVCLRLLACVGLYLLIVLKCSFIACVACWWLLMLLCVGLLVLTCRFLGYVSLLLFIDGVLVFVLVGDVVCLG